MIDIRLAIYIILAILAVGSAVIAFFVMQNRQNMDIKQLKEEVIELKKKQCQSSAHQNDTEKDIREINTKLDYITKSIDELKSR